MLEDCRAGLAFLALLGLILGIMALGVDRVEEDLTYKRPLECAFVVDVDYFLQPNVPGS